MRTILALCLAFLCINGYAQPKPPAPGKQPAYFIYALGERADQKLRVMLISTHIFLSKDHELPQDNIKVSMSLDFNQIEKNIQDAERQHPNDYDNIRFFQNTTRDIHGDPTSWNLNWPNFETVSTSDNTLAALEKIRVSVIEEYRKKGFKVYQVNFTPAASAANATGYQYYDASSSSYKKYQIDKVSALSPLYVPYYKAGEIKSMLASISGSAGGSGGGGSLVIEDKKKETEKSVIRSSPQKEKEQDDPGKWEREAALKMWEAAGIEARADSLYQMGGFFFPSALELYQQAYTLSPSARVQAKINNINSYMALGKAINELGQSIERGIEKADPDKKTRFVYMSLNYVGFLGSYKKFANPEMQDPMGAFLSFTGHRTFLSLEFRFGYMASPVYEYTIYNNDFNGSFNTGATARIQQRGIGLGMSGGLNIPLKNVVVYGLYGLDGILFETDSKLLTPGYSFEEKPLYPLFNKKITMGMTWHIPKSNIGIGLQYHLNTIKGEDDGASKIQKNSSPSTNYYLRSTTTEVYKYNNAGISFSWGFKSK